MSDHEDFTPTIRELCSSLESGVSRVEMLSRWIVDGARALAVEASCVWHAIWFELDRRHQREEIAECHARWKQFEALVRRTTIEGGVLLPEHLAAANEVLVVWQGSSARLAVLEEENPEHAASYARIAK